LRVHGFSLSTGEGTTIKGAHQSAARAAIDNLESSLHQLKATQAALEHRTGESTELLTSDIALETQPDASPMEASPSEDSV
jgi:hypothetical protein